MLQEVLVFPLSFAQQRLWFLDRLVPGNPFYNADIVLGLSGRLDAPALAASLAEIVRRHEALRTTFVAVDGEPLQVISPPAGQPLPLVDLERLPPAVRRAEAMRLAVAAGRRAFDLARGPLLRTALLRLDGGEALLLLSAHHVVCDAWSMGVLLGELAALYAAFSAGRPSPLRELPIQYADFAVWQRQRLEGEAIASPLSYWLRQLAGLQTLALPTDRPRPAVASFRGASRPVELPAGLGAAVEALCRRHGATPFMAALAAFQALLARWAGQDDVAVGTPVANRTRAELEGLIGFFANTLVLRADLAGDPPFAVALARVREVALGAYGHQEVPFEKLVEELEPARDLSRNPLFQVLFQLHSDGGGAAASPALSGVAVSFPSLPTESAKFDLAFDLWHAPGELDGRLTWATDLYDGATIGRLAGHYATLLAGAVAEPEARLSELPLLATAERHQLLHEWNATAAPRPEATVDRLVAAQAARTPDATAVARGEEALTYGELVRQAAGLGGRLRALGVGPETLVGVCLGRSPALPVTLLGIWMAGGAFLPLDPEHPAERLALVLDDARAPLVVTERRLLPRLPAGARVLCIDPIPSLPGPLPPWERAGERGDRISSSLAYALYTSGSTGRPLGVLVEHRSLASYLAWVGRELLPPGSPPLPATTGLGFDAALKQLVAPLLTGGVVWLPADDGTVRPAGVLAALAERPGAALNCVPALWEAVLDGLAAKGADATGGPAALLLGGERLAQELADRTFAALPGVALWNLYGPTEATANAVAARLTPGEPVSLGRAIANARAYVVDRRGAPTPTGVPGELLVGGAGLARGYLGRPAATAERFVPDPFSGEPGARLLSTGDRARWRADGKLEFLGRLDEQVKVRGVRVEPAEVEAALARHPEVRAAAVGLRRGATGSGGEARLVAWVVTRDGVLPPASELRRFLLDLLPEPFVPSAFMAVPGLPLSPTGKVDRQALPEPGSERPDVGRAYLAPSSALERRIARVWAAVLGLERVGVEDNFFDLGGRSLLLVKVHAALGRELGRDLPLVDLFRHPTVAALAAHLAGVDAGEAEDGRDARAGTGRRVRRAPPEAHRQRMRKVRR